jgi:hypothetical protein
MGEGEEAAEGGNAFFDRVYFEEGLGRISSMLREKRPAESLSEVTGGRPERSLRYREVLEPLGFAHEMSGVFIEGESLWGGMDLARRAGDPDFDPHEVALLKRVAPHVGIGLKVAVLRSSSTPLGGDGPAIPGVLTLDREGRVLSHTPAAKRWLDDLEDVHPSWRESDPPVPVKMVAGALRRALSPERDLIWTSFPAPASADARDVGLRSTAPSRSRPLAAPLRRSSSWSRPGQKRQPGSTPPPTVSPAARRRLSGSSSAATRRERSKSHSLSPSTPFRGISLTSSRRSVSEAATRS